MSGVFPLAPVPVSVELTSKTSTLVSMAQSGRRHVRQIGAQKWALSCEFNLMSKVEFMPIMAFVVKQQGQFGTFLFTSPELAQPQGDVSGSTPVMAGANQVGTAITTSGWKINTLVLKAGDVLTIAGDTKVYMVTDDVTSNGTGLATLNIQPPLYKITTPDLTEITTVNVQFTVQLSKDVTAYSVNGPLLYQYALDMIEVI